MSEYTQDIKSKAIKGVKWSYLTSFSSKLVQPIITIILARLLFPNDFGLYGMALIVINFLSLFQDAGLGKAFIQRDQDVEKSKNVLFYNNLILSVIWYIIIYLTAPHVAIYFKIEEVINILRILGLSFLIFPFLYIQRNILSKELEFKKLFYLNLAPAIISGTISIYLAYNGLGAWALVAGYLVGLLITAIFSWKLVPWRPKWEYDFKTSREMLGFGGYSTLEVILGWLITTVDNVFVGRFLGASKLGIYRIGYNLAIMPHSVITAPLNLVLYPTFCRMQDDRGLLKRYYLKCIEIISFFSFPFGILIFFTAPYFVPLLLGQKWVEAIPIIQLIIINGVLSSIVTMNPEIYRAIGRPNIIVKFLTVRAAFSLPAYYYASQFGIVELCFAHVCLTLFFVPINLYICSKVLNWKLSEIFHALKFSFLGAVILSVTGIIYKKFTLIEGFLNINLLFHLLAVTIVLITIYFLFLLIFANSRLAEIKSLLIQSIKG